MSLKIISIDFTHKSVLCRLFATPAAPVRAPAAPGLAAAVKPRMPQ